MAAIKLLLYRERNILPLTAYNSGLQQRRRDFPLICNLWSEDSLRGWHTVPGGVRSMSMSSSGLSRNSFFQSGLGNNCWRCTLFLNISLPVLSIRVKIWSYQILTFNSYYTSTGDNFKYMKKWKPILGYFNYKSLFYQILKFLHQIISLSFFPTLHFCNATIQFYVLWWMKMEWRRSIFKLK